MSTPRKSHTHLYKCLGDVVATRRKKLQMSQQDLAQKAGIDRAFISNIEQGKRNPSFGAVANLANGLSIRYSRLISKCEECMNSVA